MRFPRGVVPPLGTLFKIAEYTNGDSVLPPVPQGAHMKVFLNLTPYAGTPDSIPLHRYTQVTIDYGPPFAPPKIFHFGKF